MSTVAWAVAGLYLLAVLAIGLWASKRTRNARDFYIAGQGLGPVVAGLATMSAAFSGFVFVGGPGLTYRLGVVSLMIVLPLGVTPVLLCWVAGRPLRRLASREDVLTIPDVLRVRFRSPWVAALGAMAVLAGSIAYLGSQFLALGILADRLLGLGAVFGGRGAMVAMVGGVLIILVYSVGGGMLAGVFTDVLQGALMLLAALWVFERAVAVSGGAGSLARDLAAFDPDFLDPLARVGPLTAFGFFFVFGVGVLGQPHMLHKFFMLRRESDLRWMPAILGASQSICILIWLGIGLTVPALVGRGAIPPLENPDEAAAAFLLHAAPPLLVGLVFAAVIAAIMSSADSFINLGAAALARDLPRAVGRHAADELRVGRWASAVVTLAALALALVYDDLIALLGTLAFGTFAAALAPVFSVGLLWRRVSAVAAALSITTGLVVNLGLEALSRVEAWTSPFAIGALPSALALAASFAVLLLASSIFPARPPGGVLDSGELESRF